MTDRPSMNDIHIYRLPRDWTWHCTENSVSKCLGCGSVLGLLNMFIYVCIYIYINLLDNYMLVFFFGRPSVFVCRSSTTTFTVLCVAGSVVLWSNQCSVFYSRCIFWFVLLNQPDVGCGSVKLRRRGRDYAGGKCRKRVIFTQLKKHRLT